jgi:PIN domain nuclease of toxin-antitoxin system
LDLLIDTHALVWVVQGNPRMSSAVREAIIDPENRLYVSAVTAWEFADLRARNRLPALADLSVVLQRLAPTLLGLPADLWQLATSLPNLHGDPVDRMLIAHAIYADLTLVTADVTMRSYPVRSLW